MAAISSTVSNKENISFSVDCRWIATVDENNTLLEDYSIGVKDSIIVALLPTEDFYSVYNPLERFDFRLIESVLTPGLVNCHVHTPLTLLRGYEDDQSLISWLQEYIWPAEGEFVSAEFVKYGAQLAVYEMLKSGITMFNDMYYFPEVVIEVCKAAQIRIVTAKPIIDLGKGDMQQQIEDGISFAKKVNKENHPLIRSSLSAHALYSASVEEFASLLADPELKENVFHTHLNETSNESDDYKNLHNETTIEALKKAGGLRKNCVLAHCIYVNEEERKEIASSLSSVCHCPKSNMKLASGLCDIRALRESSVNVCLGTDSAASNNSLNLLSDAQLASFIEKIITNNPAAGNVNNMIRMCTFNGAKALGRERDLGSLEVGKLCDMVLFDIGATENIPCYSPLSHIVHTINKKVSHVWVNGVLAVKDGDVRTFKPDLHKVREYTQKIAQFRKQRNINLNRK